MQLILASTSPRRHELLALLGVVFEACAPSFEEIPLPGLNPLEQVQRFAQEKARSVARRRPESLVLGSDTVIECDGVMLGKPVDQTDATRMLTLLAGRAHWVHTAVALCGIKPLVDAVAVSTAVVRMKPPVARRIEEYVDTGEPLGKAGAYSIQGVGGAFIESVQGDYPGVVGLPLRLTAALLRDHGVTVPVDLDRLYREKPYPNWARFTPD